MLLNQGTTIFKEHLLDKIIKYKTFMKKQNLQIKS